MWRPPEMIVTAMLTAVLLVAGVYVLLPRDQAYRVQGLSTTERLVKVDARLPGWQTADIAIEPGTHVRVEVMKGRWTHFVGQVGYNTGASGDYICAEAMPAHLCVEPLPDFPQGGLVGRIGDQVFGVGTATTIAARESGTLALRINDADSGLYDNDGILIVKVTVE